MSEPVCIRAIPTSGLLDYWLGDDVAAEAAVEEHLMGCVHCSARLEALVRVARGIRRATRAGHFHGVLSASFVAALRGDGLRVREYHLPANGSVACTVTPDDDLVVSHLRAPLRDVQRLDLVFEDLPSGTELRMSDVPFDPAADAVVLAPDVAMLREFDTGLRRARLIAVQDGAERELGSYTFDHTRFAGPG
jgi:hypothetical protein